ALRYHEADDMSDEHDDNPVVEQRAADPQQRRLVELRGPGGPPELVVAVAPDESDDHQRQRHVRDDVPEDLQRTVAAAHRVPPTVRRDAVRASTGTVTEYGSIPTDSLGGPSCAMRCASRRVVSGSGSG